MTLHLVLLKPRADLTTTERRRFVEAFENAVRQCSSIRRVRVGRRVLHGTPYEQHATDSADFVALLEFDDIAGLQGYLAHPAHAELGRLFGQMLTSALVYDFEIGPIEQMNVLAGLAGAQ